MIFIALGKTGDVLGTLPIVYNWFVSQKRKPTVMIAREYAGILDRVCYAVPMVYDGSWTDLQGAFKLAKQKSPRVVCLSAFGADFPIEHRTSSFQLEAYERAGVLKLWDTLPLVISSGWKGHFERPTILFADHSQSSPFLHKQELYGLLVESFPQHQVLRLSDYKLPNICDFLEPYNEAAALVTIECAHLHLSAATATPVFALATDKPARWNGSAWSKRFAFYARYGEYQERKEELIESMRETLAGVKKPQPKVLN